MARKWIVLPFIDSLIRISQVTHMSLHEFTGPRFNNRSFLSASLTHTQQKDASSVDVAIRVL